MFCKKRPPIPAHAARPQTSFDPADAAAIADWHLADNGQVYVPASCGIGIDSLVAITFDAAHQAGAKGVADAPRDRDMKVRMHDITVPGGRRSWTPRNWTRRGGGVRGPAHSLRADGAGRSGTGPARTACRLDDPPDRRLAKPLCPVITLRVLACPPSLRRMTLLA